MAESIQDYIARQDQRFDAFNNEVKRWAAATKQQLLFAVASLNLAERAQLDGEIKLIKSIGAKAYKRGGLVERIAIQFERKGIFVERGVGRGRPVGSAKANALQRPWLGPTLESAVPALADSIIEEYADLIAASLRVSIPGIVNIEVKK
jgi:hypothetical protein